MPAVTHITEHMLQQAEWTGWRSCASQSAGGKRIWNKKTLSFNGYKQCGSWTHNHMAQANVAYQSAVLLTHVSIWEYDASSTRLQIGYVTWLPHNGHSGTQGTSIEVWVDMCRKGCRVGDGPETKKNWNIDFDMLRPHWQKPEKFESIPMLEPVKPLRLSLLAPHQRIHS